MDLEQSFFIVKFGVFENELKIMINKKFGTYYPTLFGKFLLLFINVGISRGKLKNYFIIFGRNI